MTEGPGPLVRRLVELRDRHGAGVAARKLAALRSLAGRPLLRASQVEKLHEVLCFWRAYPDNRRVLRAVDVELRRFHMRADVTRFRDDLLNSGMAGTDIVYPFGAPTAGWLARRWRRAMSVEWQALDDDDRLLRSLMLLVLPAEVPGLDEPPLPVREWLRRLSSSAGSDAAFFIERSSSVPGTVFVRDRFFEGLDVPLRLAAGPDTPSRTRARFAGSPVVFQTAPMRHDRPDLPSETLRAPVAVRSVARGDASRLIDLARSSMVTRKRDLDAFAWADARDVRMVECGDGLQFACIGVVPERRFLLESVYGFLTLKNGVPIGYALASALFRSSEIAYNVFETFRGGEAAHVFGRLLATVRAVFGSETFTIDPYQLGAGNDEGLDSGAWWFYYKLGFRPRARAILPLVAQERARIRRDPGYRTPRATLERLVQFNVFFSLESRREDVMGALRLGRIGVAVTDYVSKRFGEDRERAARVLAEEVGGRLLAADWRRLPPRERVAWEQWAPLVAALPGLSRWSRAERRALAQVILAKGAVRESEYVPLFDRHAKLRAALVQMTRQARG